MNNVSIIQGIIRTLHNEKFPDKTVKSVCTDLAVACNLSYNAIVSWYYERTERIPIDYVKTIAEYFDVDELFLLGLQTEEKREETDTAAYIRFKDGKNVDRIRKMSDSERETLETLLSYPTAFNRLLDTVHECVTLSDKIAASMNRLEHTSPGAMSATTTPATKDHGELTSYNQLSENDAVNILRRELPRLESLLSQQRPLRMDMYDILVGIVDVIAPRQEPPAELIADAETILSRYPESETMTQSELADFVRDLERFNVHVKIK